REHAEGAMLAQSEVRGTPSPLRAVGAIAPAQLGERRAQRCGDHAVASFVRLRRAVIAPVAARGLALQQPRKRAGARGEEAPEGGAQVVLPDGTNGLALPGHEDQGL